MEIKKRKPKRSEFIGLRVTPEEHNKIKLKANLYTGGNVSEWIAQAASKYAPNKEDLK